MGAIEEAKGGGVIKPVVVVVEADMCPKEVEVQQMSGVAEMAVESEEGVIIWRRGRWRIAPNNGNSVDNNARLPTKVRKGC